MLDLQRKSKLVEAISFFVGNTKYCGLTKLFKLLYWLDYHHFRETGETVTGLRYQAFPRGPVPDDLYREFQVGNGEIVSQFTIERNKRVAPEAPPDRTIDDDDDRFSAKQNGLARGYNAPTKITPRQRYAHKFLTRREQRIASWLAEIFSETTAEQISDVSHARSGPWQQALKERGERGEIDFLGKLFPVGKGEYLDEEELRQRVAEFEADTANFA